MGRDKIGMKKRGLAMGLVIVSLLAPWNSFYAEETEEKETIKIGFYEMDGFQYYDEYGEEAGYNIEYLQLLASITDWEYEYIKIEDFEEGCQRLETKEIDLLAPCMWAEDKEEKFSYSKLPFGTEYAVMITDEEGLFYEDYENFEGMNVAVVENSPLTQCFIEYMEEYGFSANLIYCSSIKEAKASLKEEKADALVSSLMDVEEEQKLLARFAPQNFYYLTWKGNGELLEILDKAMSRIQNTYPTFVDGLLKKYYPLYSVRFYSREEQEYVDQKGAIRVAYVDDRVPLSFTNEEGELDGISREVFDKIAELTGLKFEYVELPEGVITYRYLLDNQIDLITGVEYNSANMNSKGILLSSPYLSAQKVMVSKKDLVFNPEEQYKIAVVAGSKTLPIVLKEKYPNMEIMEYDTIEGCFEALYEDEVALLIQNQYVVEATMARPKFHEFIVVPIDGLNDQMCFSTIVSLYGRDAMEEEESLLLISILNKAISQISDDEFDNMIIRETLENQYKMTISDFLYIYRYTVTSILSGVLLVAVLIGYIIHIKAKEKAALQQKSRTDALTGLLNKETFQKAVAKYLQRHSGEESAFLFIDMDHFKEVNDRLGHDVGDQVIKDVAHKIQEVFVDFDWISRFGGDEFCVFVKNISTEKLEEQLQSANNTLKIVYETDGVSVTLSASVGSAYCNKKKATYEELFELADKAVYEAKNQGRNCYVIKELI